MAHPSVFAISVRLATVRKADRIVVLGDGVVGEQERRAALLEAIGADGRLHAAQFDRAGAAKAAVPAAE